MARQHPGKVLVTTPTRYTRQLYLVVDKESDCLRQQTWCMPLVALIAVEAPVCSRLVSLASGLDAALWCCLQVKGLTQRKTLGQWLDERGVTAKPRLTLADQVQQVGGSRQRSGPALGGRGTGGANDLTAAAANAARLAGVGRAPPSSGGSRPPSGQVNVIAGKVSALCGSYKLRLHVASGIACSQCETLNLSLQDLLQHIWV